MRFKATLTVGKDIKDLQRSSSSKICCWRKGELFCTMNIWELYLFHIYGKYSVLEDTHLCHRNFNDISRCVADAADVLFLRLHGELKKLTTHYEQKTVIRKRFLWGNLWRRISCMVPCPSLMKGHCDLRARNSQLPGDQFNPRSQCWWMWWNDGRAPWWWLWWWWWSGTFGEL